MPIDSPTRHQNAVEADSDLWKLAIDHALTALETTADAFESPRDALRALIDWHIAAAIDPTARSSPATREIDYCAAQEIATTFGLDYNRFCAALRALSIAQGPDSAPHPYPLPTSLYAGSKDWREANYAGRVRWLHAMYEAKKAELDAHLQCAERT